MTRVIAETLRRPLTQLTAPDAEGWVAPAAAACAVFLVASLLANGGLATTVPHGDVGHYQMFAERFRAGLFPYRSGFSMEYPPFALPVFLLPDYLSAPNYLLVFKWIMAICGLVTIACIARSLTAVGFERRRALALLMVVAAAPLLHGATYLNRYDLWPAMLTAAALLCFLRGRDGWGGVFLALSFAAKTYALALAPVCAIWIVRSRGRRKLVHAAAASLITCVVVYGPFAVHALHGLLFSYYEQARRGLEIESTGASLLLVAYKLHLYTYHWVNGLSLDLAGRLPDAVAVLTTLVELALVLLVSWWYLREGRRDAATFVTACAAVVAVFVTFSKVLSPQYLVWIVAVAPLAYRRLSVKVAALLIATMLATQAELVWGHYGIREGNWTVWVLFARNVGLVVLALTLAISLRPTSRSPDGRAVT